MQREGTGGARKVISNCIILAVKMGRPRWKQLASLIYVMNNAHRASMGLKRAPQDVYRVALSISLHLCARAVTACTNQQEAKQSMQFCMPALHKVCQIISYGVVVCVLTYTSGSIPVFRNVQRMCVELSSHWWHVLCGRKLSSVTPSFQSPQNSLSC